MVSWKKEDVLLIVILLGLLIVGGLVSSLATEKSKYQARAALLEIYITTDCR